MKHPALARVMSTVLAIMCVIMLVAGVFDIGDAKTRLAADEREYEKLTGRISTYEELTAKLDGVEPSKTAKEKLDAKQEQHDKDASEYRMDLAERGATQGGYKLGAEKLWEAKAQLKEGEYQYQVGRAAFEEKAAEFEATKQMLEGAQSLAEACQTLAATPAPPEVPAPDPVSPPVEPGEGATDEELGAYEEAEKAYEEYQVNLAAYTAYKTYTDSVAAALSKGNAILAQYGMGGITDIGQMSFALSIAIEKAQPMITAGEAALNEARAKLDAAGAQIESGKQTIQGNLEQIWYEMGQADEAESEFAARREALMAEADELAEETAELEQRKQDENKLSSTRLLLKKYAGISERLDNGGELAESAKAYAAEFHADYNRSYKLRLLLCALEIVGGVVGLLCIPAAYEKSKSRALLLVPAVLSIVCAVAVEAIGVASGLGKVYAAVPAIIFALLYLLAAAPKARKIVST